MRLPDGLGQLTYCLNIHRTETWAEARAALTGPVAAVKAEVSPDAPFTVGLRFSARALAELADPDAREDLKRILSDNGFVPSTMNGFPYGPFHGTRVKEDVYQPDWRHEERVDYTCGLADLMAELASPGDVVSISTVPGTYRPLAAGAEDAMAKNMLRAAAHCIRLKETTGVEVAIAIEPEPFCFLETIAGTITYFERYLHSAEAAQTVSRMTGQSPGDTADALRRHLGLCYDVCHAAVEYEDPAQSIADLHAAGIEIHKLQLSAALWVPKVNAEIRAALKAYDEPTYLHQVLSRRGDGEIAFETDLNEALSRGSTADGEEWRIHFHVPIFIADLGLFKSTQDFLSDILALHARDPISPILEVETYTWDVLPDDLRMSNVETAIARELDWVQKQLGL